MNCENCQSGMVFNEVQKYQYIESGLDNVFLNNIKVYSCRDCDAQVPVIPKILVLHNTIGYAIVSKKSLLSGAEAKFLRKNLRIKSQDWAKLLRSKKETISRWENGSQTIGLQSDLLIRYLYLRLIEEKTEIRFELKIAESLSEFNSDETAIIIDVKNIENFSYMLLTDVLNLSTNKNARSETYDFGLYLDESDEFLSEIEILLPHEQITRKIFIGSAANKQELALTA
jgi:putative zinc finger/helix-turn-helix YgiT family protein